MTQLIFNHQEKSRPTPLQEKALREGYLLIYAFAGASKRDHFVFTSSGAEAVNHAIFSAYLDITRKTGKNHYLCGALDEAPSIMAMGRLHDVGAVFQMVPANVQGIVTAKSLSEMITPRTAMLSISWGNALIGVLQPLDEIKAMCKERGILLHVEGTHVLGKGDFSFADSGADILTFDGPVAGCGGMFVRDGVELSPFILGGNEQGGMRGGPVHAPTLLEFATWAKKQRSLSDHYAVEVARQRSLFEDKLYAQIPGIKVLFTEQERLPHISCVLFPGVVSEALQFILKQKGLLASCGGNHLQQLVHVLKACGIQEPACHTGLSFALSHETTEDEIEKAAKLISESYFQAYKYSEHLLKEAIYEL